MISLPQTTRLQRTWLGNASTNSPQRFSDKGSLIRSWRDSSSTMEYAWFARWYPGVAANATRTPRRELPPTATPSRSCGSRRPRKPRNATGFKPAPTGRRGQGLRSFSRQSAYSIQASTRSTRRMRAPSVERTYYPGGWPGGASYCGGETPYGLPSSPMLVGAVLFGQSSVFA
jgi:hypothetical protein